MDRKTSNISSLKITLAGLFRKLTKMQETKPKIGELQTGTWVCCSFLVARLQRRRTYPAAGVIATSAIMAPVTEPHNGEFPRDRGREDIFGQVIEQPEKRMLALPPEQAAMCVEVTANTARRLPPSAEPPLKPNIQSIESAVQEQHY